jgi:hypothetical protein
MGNNGGALLNAIQYRFRRSVQTAVHSYIETRN